MPIPAPQSGESKNDFVDRCMSDETVQSEFPDSEQRVAVCNDTWRQKTKNAKFPSHEVVFKNGSATIRNLELFSGFDPSLDDERDDDISRFDEDEINNIAEITSEHMKRGQFPQLILRHNPDDKNLGDRPVIGRVENIKTKKVKGVPGIVGDVTMPVEHFDALIASNAYPRRSAEIWSDGFLSEVALLGSETPARALPDTRFEKFGPKYVFHRAVPSVNDKDVTMAEKDNDNKDKMAEAIDELKKRIEQLEKSKNATDEDDEAKTKNQDDSEDDEEKMPSKSKSTRSVDEHALKFEREKAKLQRENEHLSQRLDEMEHKFNRKHYDQMLDQMEYEGYQIPDRDEVLDRICAAKDSDAELEYHKKLFSRKPLQQRVSKAHARVGGDSEPDDETLEAARKYAFDKCREDGNSEKYMKYRDEFLKNKKAG